MFQLLSANPYNVKIEYDMNVWGLFKDTIITTIRACGDMGWWILAFGIVWLILTILSQVFANAAFIKSGVKKRSVSRKIFEADMKGNLDDMVEDGVRHKVLSSLVNNRFGQRHMQLEVDAKVHSMEVSHKAKLSFSKKHPEAYGEMQDMRREQAEEYYKSRGLANKSGNSRKKKG